MVDAISSLGDVAATANLGAPGISPLSAGMMSNAKIDQTSQDFEAMFATQMLQPMFETVHVDSQFGGGHGEEVMRSFMLQEYGKIIAKSGRLGIASQVKSEMLRVQEEARKQGATPLQMGAKNAYQNISSQQVSHVAAR